MQSDLVHTCLKSNVTSLIWLSHCPGESNAKVPRPQCEPPPLSVTIVIWNLCSEDQQKLWSLVRTRCLIHVSQLAVLPLDHRDADLPAFVKTWVTEWRCIPPALPARAEGQLRCPPGRHWKHSAAALASKHSAGSTKEGPTAYKKCRLVRCVSYMI